MLLFEKIESKPISSFIEDTIDFAILAFRRDI